MSHTNQTPNYHLPQFIGTDKPAWLVDFNQSMSDIDTQMKANATASATAEANAQSALSGVSALNSQVGGLQTDVTAIQTQMPLDEAQIATNAQNISTQASAIVNANNRIDTLNGKVGDLADLDTTDKSSIVNAVNEVKGDINKGSVSVTGDGVKTNAQLLNALFALVDMNKISSNSKLILYIASTPAEQYIPLTYKSATELIFSSSNLTTSALSLGRFDVKVTGSESYSGSITSGGSLTITSTSSNVLTTGWKYEVVY